jgi:hypothetical protein
MLIPTTFLFHYQVSVRRVAELPRRAGPPLSLGPECRLPWLICDPETVPFADVRVAWNEQGLGLQVEVAGRTVPINHRSLQQSNPPAIDVWVDTRPTPDSHRAGRYCTQWRLHPQREPGSRRQPIVEAVAIARAREEASAAKAESVLIDVEMTDGGYRLEAWFARESLPGFDPEASAKLGFFYRIEEPELGTQIPWEAGGFPVESDPSLWLTLLLRDE